MLGFVGFKFYNNIQKVNHLESKIDKINLKIDNAKMKNKQLEEQLTNINDLKYVEKMARKKLGLVKKGEILLVPVKDDKEHNQD